MALSEQQQKTAGRLSLLFVIFLTGTVILYIGRQVWILIDYPFDFDEANHANGALALFLELHAGDFTGFVNEFYSQGFYPPGFSWLKAIVFLFFGPSPLAGRLFSLACLFLACIVIYFLAREIDELFGWLAGVIAVALTLTIQPLLVNSAQVMMEAPGLLATFAFLLFYVRALKQPSPARLLLTSLLLSLTFFTKFTYGVIAVITVGMMELSTLFDAGQNRHTKYLFGKWLWLIGPFALILLIWFVAPGNLSSFGDYATAQPPEQPWVTSENLFFYPRSIALHQSPSPIFALITVSGLIWAVTQWQNSRVRLLLIYFIMGMAVMTVNLPKNPRFIATVVPAAHVLSGLLLAWMLTNWRSQRKFVRIISKMGVLTFLFATLFSLPTLKDRFTTYPSLLEVEYETDPGASEILRWIQETVPKDQRFYILNYWDQLSPQLIAWFRATESYPNQPDFRFARANMPAHLVQEPTTENIAALRQTLIEDDASYLVLFEGGPWGLRFWPEYTEAMADMLEFVAAEDFQIKLYETGNWQDKTLLQKSAWEQVKTASQEELHIKVIVYRIK